LVSRRTRWLRIASKVARYAAAAAIVGAVILVGQRNRSADKIVAEQTKIPQNISPGDGKQVTLTLSNGTKIPITDSELFLMQDNTSIVKCGKKIIYQENEMSIGTIVNEPVGINSIETPKGRQQEMVLPDGSRVWLNAVSRIDYPVAFRGKERSVTLSGEAYFEVVPDKSRPFKVNVGGMDVKVTGTKFNIRAYDNEAVVKSTLLEGGVKISQSGTAFALDLAPGQQLQFDPATRKYRIVRPDVEAACAWREGKFCFDSTDLSTLMRDVARWYNIEVEYPYGVPNVCVFGEIDRDTDLSELLKILDENKIKTKLDGRKLQVLP
jgi:transmembrane sensor